jgi:hypothetical protein
VPVVISWFFFPQPQKKEIATVAFGSFAMTGRGGDFWNENHLSVC